MKNGTMENIISYYLGNKKFSAEIERAEKDPICIGSFLVLVVPRGIIALARRRQAAGSLVQSRRPTCSRQVVRRSFARSGFCRRSRLASD